MEYSKPYVLITPARNEEAYIELTIKSVVSQTVLPKKWIVVSDGSTDRTDEIVEKYVAKFDFIELFHLDATENRNFGSKVKAIRRGFEKIRHIRYAYFGNLDADISFNSTYYEKILTKFGQNAKLGIAGGLVIDAVREKNQNISGSLDSVACAVQMFRRQCYEQIGGYIPLRVGGEDAAAEVMARMNGWETRTFPEIKALHHRTTGTEGRNIYRARFLNGVEEYLLGYHPLFQMAKCLYRFREKPYLVGSLLRMFGYYLSWCRRQKRQVSDDFIRYLRGEQMNKIRSLLIK